MSDIMKIDFNVLPRSVRTRFIACTHGQATPAPLLSQKTSPKASLFGWIFGLLVFGLAALAVIFGGFGDYTSSSGVHSPLVVFLLYIPIGFLLFAAIFAIVQRIVVRSPYPYAPGRYLFSSDFVDARTDTLRIIPTRTLTDFKGVHHHTNGAYTHTQLTFTFEGGVVEEFSIRGKDAAQGAIDAFWNSQRAIAGAAQANDWQTVSQMDPFFEARRMNTWEGGKMEAGVDPNTTAKSTPAFFKWKWAAALVAALFVTPVVALARNLVSDEMMFSSAKSVDSEYGYKAYREHGWRHADEAKEKQPFAALRAARKANTVSELRRVVTEYKGSPVEADARSSMHELYTKTLSDFRSKASSNDPRMLPFMERLIAYLEKNDTATVRVTFDPPSNVALSDADTNFRNEFSGKGRTVAPISPYFNTTRSGPRETAIVSNLNTAFGKIFPTDILKLEQASSGAAGSSSKEPTINIKYTVAPSGDAYTGQNDTRVYVGINVLFDMKMSIPNDSATFTFKLTVEPPDQFSYYTKPGESDPDAIVYDTMAQRAFDEFTTKLQGVFFKNVPSTTPTTRSGDSSESFPGSSGQP